VLGAPEKDNGSIVRLAKSATGLKPDDRQKS